jgi:hypothetical protein
MYPAWSYDLSNATDRLPVNLQTDLLNYLIGGNFGDLWKEVLVSRAYNHKGQNYYYSVGQPMGGYSSFAMLDLTHHYIVKYSANIVGYDSYSNYSLLGDDIVLFRFSSIADAYKTIMHKLGVTINRSKSVISKDGSCEFTKRI